MHIRLPGISIIITCFFDTKFDEQESVFLRLIVYQYKLFPILTFMNAETT